MEICELRIYHCEASVCLGSTVLRPASRGPTSAVARTLGSLNPEPEKIGIIGDRMREAHTPSKGWSNHHRSR